jgi:hypothetical protein
MLFGTRLRFGLECSFDKTIELKYSFGNICLWALGRSIGQRDQTVILDVFAEYIRRWITADKPEQTDFREETPETILSSIEQCLYTSTQPNPELIVFEKKLRRYVLCPGGGESFDGEFAVVLPIGENYRFIWRDYSDHLIRELLLSRSEFDQVIVDFLEWFTEEKRVAN